MSKGTVLVVDDDRDFLEELKDTLSLSGYTTEALSNAEGALALAVAIKPDVILIDVRMPGKGGLELAAELKSVPDTADIPLIAMTGYYTRRDVEAYLEGQGVSSFLIKPFDPEMLIRLLESHGQLS